MKSFASALLFSGLAIAGPLVQKRNVFTEVEVETVWTTTTLYVGGATPAAEALTAPSSAPAVPSASPSAVPVPSVAVPSVVVPSAAPSVAAPSAAAPSPKPVEQPQAKQAAAPATSSGGATLASGTGDATWYDVTVGLGSCGLPIASPDSAVVAMAVGDMKNGANSNNNPLCGKTITINYGGSTHTAQVYDSCEGCAPGSIDLSQGFFKTVFPSGDGRVSGVSWTVS